MSGLNPFINYFVEEALKKASLHRLLDSDINALCDEIVTQPVDILPRVFRQGDDAFSYVNPCVLHVYPSKEDGKDFLLKSEQLIEALHGISKQAVFEIRGNIEKITCYFYGEESDIRIIESALNNYYPKSFTTTGVAGSMTGDYFVYDFLPDAPFYKAMTSFMSFIVSPLNLIPKLLLGIEAGREGVYQVLFRPAPDECHGLVRDAIDSEYRALIGADNRVPPSLQTASERVEYKSPQFKSYFSVCTRVILPTDNLEGSVSAFLSNYTYGSKAFRIFDNRHYGQEQVRTMLNDRVSFHCGFLVNSHELTGLLHIPFQVLHDKQFRGIFDEAPAGDRPEKTLKYDDVSVGRWACGSKSEQVYLPEQREVPHVHVLGVSRVGKSILLGHLAVEKFKRGEAVFVIDPHGDLIDTILKMVPEDRVDDVVLIDFGLESATPQITIKDNVDITNPSKASDDLTDSMRDVTSGREKFWGPKMAYLVSCLYFIYCVMPDFHLTHIRQLVSRSKKAKVLRAKARAKITHPIIREFLDELDLMPYEAMMPVITRLSHLLLDEKSLRLFTLDSGRISISEIMETGKLCLINLSVGIIGRQRSSILSGLMDSLINNNALARANTAYSERKPCTLIKDEFYLGPGDLDSQLTGLAKYGLSVVFANQYLSQVDGQTREVLGTAGTRIVFKVRREDAEVLGRDFGIAPEEFTSLQKFEAFVKIEDEVVKVKTPKPVFNETDYSEVIIHNCLEKYYLLHEKAETSGGKGILLFDTL